MSDPKNLTQKQPRQSAMRATFQELYGSSAPVGFENPENREAAEEALEKWHKSGHPSEKTVFATLKRADEIDTNGDVFTKEALEEAASNQPSCIQVHGEGVKGAYLKEITEMLEEDGVKFCGVDFAKQPSRTADIVFTLPPGESPTAIGVLSTIKARDPDRPVEKIKDLGITGPVFPGKGRTFSIGCKAPTVDESVREHLEKKDEMLAEYCRQDVAFSTKLQDHIHRMAQHVLHTVALAIDGPVLEFQEIAAERGFGPILLNHTTHRKLIESGKTVKGLWIWESPLWMADKVTLGRLLETLEHLGEDCYYYIHVKSDGSVETRGRLKENEFNLRVGHTVLTD
jgi:hypothetical protein